jgi:hypothetical protein
VEVGQAAVHLLEEVHQVVAVMAAVHRHRHRQQKMPVQCAVVIWCLLFQVERRGMAFTICCMVAIVDGVMVGYLN